jgi:hypothetical protein
MAGNFAKILVVDLRTAAVVHHGRRCPGRNQRGDQSVFSWQIC